MSRVDRARQVIEPVLDRGETIRAMASGQLKDLVVKPAPKTAVVRGLVGVAHLAAMGASPPPVAWLVVTGTRLLVFEDPRPSHRPVGDLLLDVSRDDVLLTSKAGWLNQVVVLDTAGDPLVRLNFGVRKKAVAALLAA